MRPFATGFDVLLIIAVIWAAFHFDSFLPFLGLGLSPRAWGGVRESRPLTMAGIYGITPDGCYLVMGEDGVVRKSPPIRPLGTDMQ